ncbi:MAG: exosortase system-associated protein, TIGR04073 family [Zetaproteobacteria bacterium]|nr:MAG: exosortase system-associated protein, TIGR04073 family [Zetaproteobacteria bacterium]
MKSSLMAALLLLFGSALATPTATAAEQGYAQSVADKFARGFANTATGWLELPKYVIHEGHGNHIFRGLTVGLLEGVMHTVGRTLVGVVDLGTFFVPTPEIVHPRYVWSPFSGETSYGTSPEKVTVHRIGLAQPDEAP